MSSKTILILVLSVLWFWLCDYWYTCHVKQVCYGCNQEVAAASLAPAASKVDKGTLYFDWSNQKAFTNSDKFPAFKTAKLKGMTEDNLLIISGPYYKNEKIPEGYANMGIARAAQIRSLFSEVPEERIRLESHLVGDGESVKDGSFQGTKFRWETVKIEETEVVQLADKSIILFPFNSSVKETDQTIDEYLEKLAERVKTSNEKIELTGHTDNVGNDAYNKNLGRKRAKYISKILQNKGVKKSQITVQSKGESEPVSTNETEQGKHQNRRVVLRIK